MEANLENIKKALFESNFIFKSYYTYPTAGLDKLWMANELDKHFQFNRTTEDTILMNRIFEIRSLLLNSEEIFQSNDNKTAIKIEIKNIDQPVYLSYKDGFTSINMNVKQHDNVYSFDLKIKQNFETKIVTHIHVATFHYDIKNGRERKLISPANVVVHVKEITSDNKIILASICDGTSNWTHVNLPFFTNFSPEIDVDYFIDNTGMFPKEKVKEILKNFDIHQSKHLTSINSKTGMFEE